ncbi:MAG TPA: hypothetical protein VL155_18380 [Terriglobales bacterium]|jgi:hypothetical protein|nr:hypothetical protein [Terriglobales bacterium]
MHDLSTLEVFVVLLAFSAILVNVWLASAVLERYRLKRATAILAAISAIIMAWLYVSIWGFKLLA